MNFDYDNVPDYVKIGIENAKKANLQPAPDPPVISPKLSVGNKIRNLFCSVKNIVSDASNGKEVTVDNVNYNKRVNTCIECPYISEDKNVCTQCGCFIRLKAKFKSNTCPKKYW